MNQGFLVAAIAVAFLLPDTGHCFGFARKKKKRIPAPVQTASEFALPSAPELPRNLPLDSVEYRSVLEFGARGDGSSDDTAAIRSAIHTARHVYFPPGRYKITSTISLASDVRLRGEPRRSIVFGTFAGSLFKGGGNDGAFLERIVVEDLDFEGAPLNKEWKFAVELRTARQVVFRNNVVRRINAIWVTSHLPINVWDGTPDPAATAGLTREDQLSSDILIQGNQLQGPGRHNPINRGSAINLRYANRLLVENNVIDGFDHGIIWEGGDANPSRGGGLENPRWIRNLTVRNNRVTSTEGGIWGAMSDGALITRNEVESCLDVCLDSEGGVNTVFSDNVAKNASGGGVLATFHFNRNVWFIRNQAIQDGTHGHRLYQHWNDSQDPREASVILKDNTLTFTGDTGLGTVGRDAIKLLRIEGNRLNDVAIALTGNNGGGSEVIGNTIALTRGGQAGIEVTGTHGPGGDPRFASVIRGNSVRSSVRNTADAGIRNYQSVHNENWIQDNEVTGLAESILVGPGGRYYVTGNRASGTISKASGTSATIRDNRRISDR